VFLKFPTRHSAVPLRALVPNMITSVALACGLASLHFVLQGRYENALIAIGTSWTDSARRCAVTVTSSRPASAEDSSAGCWPTAGAASIAPTIVPARSRKLFRIVLLDIMD